MTRISTVISQMWGICAVIFLLVSLCYAQDEPKNWLMGGSDPSAGRFDNTIPIPYPWEGIDADGFLRRAVAWPAANPFITKSNEFTYAWLGQSVSMVDLDADGLPDLVSPDGNGIFWFWKNVGKLGEPAFARGEPMPLLIDDQRSEFVPILQGSKVPNANATFKEIEKPGLSLADQRLKERIDESRKRELERLLRINERRRKEDQVSKKELEAQVAEKFPYPWERGNPNNTPALDATPSGRFVGTTAIPPGGLSCRLNTFRRLRLVATPCDWNRDGKPDFVAGDSAGTIYVALNSGQPGRPDFGYTTRSANAIPLKVQRVFDNSGRPVGYRPIEFLNYAMPFVCDWDGNRVPDLLLGEGTYSVNAIRLFPNATQATLQSPPREMILYSGDGRTFLSPFAWDWDGDGDLDLFVCDDRGRLTLHRRKGTPATASAGTPAGTASVPAKPGMPTPSPALAPHPISADGSSSDLEPPQDLTLDGGNDVLAYCTPQPCDWNADGIMDLIWGEPFGRIMVALGKEKGGLTFAAPQAIRSTTGPRMIQFPAWQRTGCRVSLAAVPARSKIVGVTADGGTGSAIRYYLADGSSQVNKGGWPEFFNNALYGQMPSWSALQPPSLESQLGKDRAGQAPGIAPSWGIAPMPGDVWEVVDEPSAPGKGKTLLLRWHDSSQNAVFKKPTVSPPQWTPGVAIRFHSGSSDYFTDKPITIKFHMKLVGNFTRMDVGFNTNWGPLDRNGKPPAEGGEFVVTSTPSTGNWFEFIHTEPPHQKYLRGIDGTLEIFLLGKGEVRIRDVRVLEGD